MDWMKVLFNTDHTMSLPAIIGIAVLGIGVSLWIQWYKNTYGGQGGSISGKGNGAGSASKAGGGSGKNAGKGSASKAGGNGTTHARRNPTKKKKRR
ncbi:MAG: hypothetical protein HFI35_14960 [Roseburia sp.]|jgi:hypothetical protein|nr:hypothetical protein [Roseburia sp.]